jgi:hypothetical protein
MSKAGAVATVRTWPATGGRWGSSDSAAVGGPCRLAGFEALAGDAWKAGRLPSAGRSSGRRSPGGPRPRARVPAVDKLPTGDGGRWPEALPAGRPAAGGHVQHGRRLPGGHVEALHLDGTAASGMVDVPSDGTAATSRTKARRGPPVPGKRTSPPGSRERYGVRLLPSDTTARNHCENG